jgi:hypothetical protein
VIALEMGALRRRLFVRAEIDRLKGSTDKPFGVNLVLPLLRKGSSARRESVNRIGQYRALANDRSSAPAAKRPARSDIRA